MLSTIDQVPCVQVTSGQQTYSSLVHIVNSSAELEPLSQNYGVSQVQTQDLKNLKNLVFYPTQGNYSKVLFFYTELSADDLKKSQQSVRDVAGSVFSTTQQQKLYQIDVLFSDTFLPSQQHTFHTELQLKNHKPQLKGIHGDEEEQQKQKESLFKPLKSVNYLNCDINTTEFQHSQLISYHTLLCRHVAGSRGNYGLIQEFVDYAEQIAKLSGVTLKTLKGSELLDQGMQCHHAVGRGSIQPPVMINLTYNGDASDSSKVLALVGKGIVFDTGGLNIKMTGNIEGMFLDKHGASSVLLAFKAVVEAKLKINLTCTLAMAENAIGHDSYRPSDILTSKKGITVEIANTDAEGRLVLSDCMTWTQLNYKPHTLIELSTLTGASMIALGCKTSALFSNNDDLAKDIASCGEKANEAFWRLPITNEHRDLIKSGVADIKNTGGRYGGACTAAAFLECFVEKGVKWAHLDIAGPAEVDGLYATGFGVQTLFNYIKDQQ